MQQCYTFPFMPPWPKFNPNNGKRIRRSSSPFSSHIRIESYSAIHSFSIKFIKLNLRFVRNNKNYQRLKIYSYYFTCRVISCLIFFLRLKTLKFVSYYLSIEHICGVIYGVPSFLTDVNFLFLAYVFNEKKEFNDLTPNHLITN